MKGRIARRICAPPPCAPAQPAVLGRGAVHHRENLLRMSSDHSALLSKTLGNSVLEL